MFGRRIFQIILVMVLLVGFFCRFPIFAQTPTLSTDSTVNVAAAGSATPTPTANTSQKKSDLENKIQQLQGAISDLQKQENTLSSQIAVMDSQVKLTEYRIESTKQQILSFEEDIDTAQKKILSLEGSVAQLTKLLLNRLVVGYELGIPDNLQVLLSSNSIDSFFSRSNYLRIVQRHDKHLVYDTVQAKNDYANQKQIYEDEKKKVVMLQAQLVQYTQDLSVQKNSKQQLLSQTQGSEAQYQQLLARAQAQLAGFSGFADSQGGASLLGNQTICDSWGCYYNQRDSQWGGIALNHTQYSIASDGCLLTSIAMVYTHYGHKDVTPISVNSNPSNFASYYPAYLLFTVTVNGVTAQRIGTYIDATLSSGNPVIVGIRYGNGNTHFVVLTGGSNGNYLMNDPFTPNGHNISFTSKYSLGSIFEIDKMVF